MLDGIPDDPAGKGPIHISEPSFISDDNIKVLCEYIVKSVTDESMDEDKRFTFVGQRVHEAPPDLEDMDAPSGPTKPTKRKKAAAAPRKKHHRKAKDVKAMEVDPDTESDNSQGSYAPSRDGSVLQDDGGSPAPMSPGEEPPAKKSVSFESPLPVKSSSGAPKRGARKAVAPKPNKGKGKAVEVDDVTDGGKKKASNATNASKASKPTVSPPVQPAKRHVAGPSRSKSTPSTELPQDEAPAVQAKDLGGKASKSAGSTSAPERNRMPESYPQSLILLREFRLDHPELEMQPGGRPWVATFNHTKVSPLQAAVSWGRG